jgi:uncharacterized protein (TIGR02453 family)
MTSDRTFTGFPKETFDFYRDLSRNNNRNWFEENRPIYKNTVMANAQAFVQDLGEALQEISPGLVADLRTNGSGSIFRIYKDTRFSLDKRPYKTFLGIFFWADRGNKMDMPGFYFHLEPDQLMLATGMHVFPKAYLDIFREAVADDKHNAKLCDSIHKVLAHKEYQLGGKHYKRMPRGYNPDCENAEYLLYNGLYTSVTMPVPNWIHTAEAIDQCTRYFKNMLPVHQWLVSLLP